MSNNKTLVDVANTQPGAYVQGPFQGTMSRTAARTSGAGKVFYKGTLTDGLTTIDCTSFGRNLTTLEGQLITVNGMGIKRGEDYKGMAQITIGDKAVIIGNSAGAAPAQSIPLAQTGYVSFPALCNEAPRNEGIVIGACLNKAVDVCISVGATDEQSIWRVASRLLRISNRLQKGDLHTPSTADAPQAEVADNEQPY